MDIFVVTPAMTGMSGMSAMLPAASASTPFDWSIYTGIVARFDFTDLTTMYTSMAAQFDGTNQLERDEAAVTSYPLTMCCWGKTASASNQALLFVGDKDSSDEYQALYISGTDVVASSVNTAATGSAAENGANPDDGNWHFAVAVFNNAASRTAYVDGTDDATEDTTSITINAVYDRTSMGRLGDSTPTLPLTGEGDSPMIFNTALTPTEIGWLYNNGSGRSYAAMVDSYDVNTVENRATAFASASTQYLQADTACVTAYPFSISLWYKQGNFDFDTIWYCGDKDSDQDFCKIYMWDYPWAYIVNGGSNSSANKIISGQDGKYHHVVAVFTSNTSRRVYADASPGTLVSTNRPITATYDRTTIGRAGKLTPNQEFNGTIDEVCVFHSALSQADITALYNDGAGVDVEDLVEGNVVLPSGKTPEHAWPLSNTHASGVGADVGSVGGINLTPVNSPTDALGIPTTNVPPDPANCVFALDLSEHDGIRMDESGNDLHMTPGGTNPVTAVAGVVSDPGEVEDRALEFDGIDQRAEADTAAISAVGTTIQAWVKSSTTAEQTALWIGDKDVDDVFVRIGIDGSGNAFLGRSASGGGEDVTVGANIDDGEYHLIFAVLTATDDVDLYVDDNAAVNDTTSVALTGFDRTSIGRHGGATPATYFDGVIDEVAVYSSALSGAQRTTIWNNGIGLLNNDASLPTASHYWNLSKNNASGAGEDVGSTGGINLTLAGTPDPTDANGIPAGQALDGLVSMVEDQSGQDNHITQATLSKRPELVHVSDGTGVALQFDGVDDYLQSAAFTALTQPNDIFVSVDTTDNSADQTIYDGIAAANENSLQINSTGDLLRIDGGVAASTTIGADYGNTHTILATFNGASSTVWRDGGAGEIENSGTEALTGVTVGMVEDGSSNPMKGTYRYLAINDGALNTVQRDAIGTELATNQGISWTGII